MKKKLVYLILSAMLVISLAGCGSTTDADQADQSTQDTVVEEETQKESESSTAEETKTDDSTESTDTTGVYPTATGITEINMGVTEDICTFKVPLNYVLAGLYYDENDESQKMDGLDSATTTVEEALAAGSFDTDKHLADFTMTSLDADSTMLTVRMYTESMMTWDEIKDYYPDAGEVSGADVPTIVDYVEGLDSDNPAVYMKINDEITLVIIYSGPLKEELTQDELAQRLYNLVTIK